MNELVEAVSKVSPQAIVGVLVPLVGLTLRVATTAQRGRLGRRMKLHARIRGELKEASQATTAIDELLTREAEVFRDRQLYLLRRKLDGVRLGLSIAFLLATGVGAAYLAGWVIGTWGTAAAFLSVPVTALVLITGIAFTAVGFSAVYSDPESKAEESAAVPQADSATEKEK